MLPIDTIREGVHVKLDVRAQKLTVVDPVKHTEAVIVKEYEIRSLDATLDFFEYLEAQKETGRFRTVTIV